MLNYWKYRQALHFHRTRADSLQDRVWELEAMVSNLQTARANDEYYASEVQSRLEARLSRAHRDADDARRQAESDQWHREEQIRKVTRDLERAQSYGDEYGIAEATRKMKRLV